MISYVEFRGSDITEMHDPTTIRKEYKTGEYRQKLDDLKKSVTVGLSGDYYIHLCYHPEKKACKLIKIKEV